jgi:adenylate kinase
MKKIYIFNGPPGSGKGTQADLLSEKYKLKIIQPGVLLRQQVKKKTELGKEVKKYLDQGNLVPNELISSVIFTQISRARKDVVLDGFPRHLDQAKELVKYIKLNNSYQVIIFEIDLPYNKVLKRITGRRSCACGGYYDLLYDPPEVKNNCDECGKTLYVREDAKPVVVKRRIEVYQTQTKPALNYLKQNFKRTYYKINGDQAIEVVHQEILNKIK